MSGYNSSYVRNTFNMMSFREFADNHNLLVFKKRQSQLETWGIISPVVENIIFDIKYYKEWVKEHYGDIPKIIALKLISHNFNMDETMLEQLEKEWII